jgi:hypothetical protein
MTTILPRLFLTGPVLVAAGLTAWFVVAEQLELPFAMTRLPANIAEAAADGHAPEVVRRLRFGEDPTRVYPLRDHYISAAVMQATVPEAAMWSRSVELIRLLDREGAIVGEPERRELTCLAADLRMPDVVMYLSAGEHVACTPGLALRRLIARTTGEVVR